MYKSNEHLRTSNESIKSNPIRIFLLMKVAVLICYYYSPNIKLIFEKLKSYKYT